MAYEYELIEGRDRAGARDAIKKAVKAGFPAESVISTEDGWLVPTKEYDAPEPLSAHDATLDAWGEERQEEEGSANIEVVESQVPDTTEEPAKKPTRRTKAAKAAEENKE